MFDAKVRGARRVLVAVATALICSTAAAAQTPAPRTPDPAATRTVVAAKDYKAAQDIAFKPVSFYSEGVRLHGEVFRPKSAAPTAKLPVVVMAHGWGGTAAGFRRDAEELARAGFHVMTFDYRGWGESDARVILTGANPSATKPGKFTAEVQAVREYVDPWEQTEDWFNAINFVSSEPGADAGKIGLRGSSYSGGTILRVAALDPRVKAVVSQVGGIPDRTTTPPQPGAIGYEFFQQQNDTAARMARGELGYPEPRKQVVGRLIGSPVGNKTARWAPAADARDVTVPALFVLAEDEELIDNRTNGLLAYERVRGPKKLIMVPGKHYDIYGPHRAHAVSLAADWFKQHLK